jgi:hypothetical protein
VREKTITVEVDERGNSSVDLTGFQGYGCAIVVRSFRGNDSLALDRTKREFPINYQRHRRICCPLVEIKDSLNL